MARLPRHPFVYLTADVVALSLRPGVGLSVLLVRRANPPHQGRWALPGGFVDEGEDVERAARRELREEAGVRDRRLRLTQLGAYTAPRRDPRHRTVSVAFLAAVRPDVTPLAGDDAADAQWLPVAGAAAPRRLAFDHARIMDDAVDRLREDLESTSRALDLLPSTFTIGDLRAAYEQVWGRRLDPGNFQRKVTGVPGLLAPTGTRTEGARGRPAALYTAGGATQIWPPMSRDRER